MNALITGGEAGLGAGISMALNKAGYDVHNIPGVLLRQKQKKRAIDEFINSIGQVHIDLVINNFGINHLSWIGETEEEDEEILAINTMAPYWVINALVKQEQICRVLNVASVAGEIPQRCTSLYCASKAALIHMTRVMARELAPSGWVINSFSPGKILGTKMTKMTDAQVNELRGWEKEQADDYALSLLPMKRFTTVEECVEAIMKFIAMPKYVNGVNFKMHGAA